MFQPINPYLQEKMRSTFGRVSGTAAEVAFPDVPAQFVSFSAYAANKMPFYIGEAGNCRYEIGIGDSTELIPVQGGNLNTMVYKNVSGAAETLSYWAVY